MNKNNIENKTKPKIFHLAFGYGIKAQIVKIKRKFFSTKRMATISSLIILIAGSTVFFSANYFAKGATYGWLQSTWSGGVLSDQSTCEAQNGTWDATNSECIATHTDNQSNWTAYSSKDDNVDTSNDELTLSSGSAEVEDTTTGDFDGGSDDGTALVFNTSGDQLTASVGYDATGICGDFEVWPVDRSKTANWTTAMSYCDNLCPTCDLPTSTELACICNNKASFGDNFELFYYWSATQYNSTYAYFVNFSNCAAYYFPKTNAYYVRCVRRL